MNLSDCQQFDLLENRTDSCTCINMTMWSDAVLDPDPDAMSCQFPQVVALALHNVMCLMCMCTCAQYFYYSAMIAMIGSVIFIRMNWLYKALLNLIAFIVYTVVVLGTQSCLFDNYDKTIFGFCTSCDQFIETKTYSSILLFTVLCATILLGRHVSPQLSASLCLLIHCHAG